jgi:HD-like signal output (HDOD) protein
LFYAPLTLAFGLQSLRQSARYFRKKLEPTCFAATIACVSPRDAIIASIGELSVTPRVIRHLSKFLQSPDEDMTDAIAALKAEPVLTAAILAGCNAPQQFRGGKILDLDTAVHRIGYRETYRIALLVTFRQGLRLPNLPDNQAADCLWRRAATAACAMEQLTTGRYDQAAAYTTGLLHLIGCFILARSRRCAAALDPHDPVAAARAQMEQCAIAYPEAGAIAMEKWGFPPQISMPIRLQLDPPEQGEFAESAALLARAASIAMWIETSRPGSPIFVADAATLPPDELTRNVERASKDLLEVFQPATLRRPAWAVETERLPGSTLARVTTD